MVKIALFGGAFDPMHEGHLHIAQLAQKRLNLDRVYFVPLNQAVHKDQPVLAMTERLQKIADLIKDEPAFEISKMELERSGDSYAIDTVTDFIKKYTSSPEAYGRILSNNGEDPSNNIDFQKKHDVSKTELDLYYIIGTDAFAEIFNWKDAEKLLALVKFIVVERPGYSFSKIEKLFKTKAKIEYLDRIFFIEDKGLDISSTQIRESLNAGKN